MHYRCSKNGREDEAEGLLEILSKVIKTKIFSKGGISHEVGYPWRQASEGKTFSP